MLNQTIFRNLFVGTIVAAGVVASNAAFAAEHDRPAIISVQGVGTVSVAPDMAVINLGVVREAKTARAALTANNEAMSKVLATFKEMGIEDKDLQTSNLNISPRYHHPKRNSNGEQKAPMIVGYVVNNDLTVRVRDLDSVGVLLDQAVTLGVNQGGAIQFTNSDASKIMQEARIAAVKDARSKAETIVSELGVELGKLSSISEGSHTPRPVGIRHAKAMAFDSVQESVPIAAGENTYRVNVNINWELNQ